MEQIVVLGQDSASIPGLKDVVDDLGLQLTEAKDFTHDAFKSSARSLVLLNFQTLKSLGIQHLDQFDGNNNFRLGIIVDEDSVVDGIEALSKHDFISHVFQQKDTRFKEDLFRVLKIYSIKESLVSDLDDIKNYLLPAKIENVMDLKSSDQRWEAYEQIGSFAESLPCFKDFPNIVRTVASEMIMNAFYDGPRDLITGIAKYPDRAKSIDLGEGESIKFLYGADDQYLWLVVEDTFGTLDKQTVARALFRAISERTALTDSKGGAGLGLLFMFDFSSEIVFFLSKSGHTYVGCKMRITKRNRIFSSEVTSLHII